MKKLNINSDELLAEVEVPFPVGQVLWRVTNTANHRTREARVTGTSERWLEMSFEAPPHALPREGMPADSDSGAPVLLNMHGRWELAGLVSHKFASGDLSKIRCCVYGQITYQVCVSRCADWIEGVTSSK